MLLVSLERIILAEERSDRAGDNGSAWVHLRRVKELRIDFIGSRYCILDHKFFGSVSYLR